MRSVDADAILEKIDKERKYLIARGQIGAEHILVKYCRDFVEDAPTVEPKQGEWICVTKSTFPQYQPDEYKCPFCNVIVHRKTNFCPNCGADMRKGGAE